MRGCYDWIDVSEEKEPSDESVESVWLCVGELLVNQGPRGFAQPPDAKGNIVDGVLQKFQDLQHKVLQYRDMFGYQQLYSWVAFSLEVTQRTEVIRGIWKG